MWEDNSFLDVFYGSRAHILARRNGLKLKSLNDGFAYYKHAASDSRYLMLNLSKSVLIKKLIYILDGLRVSIFSANVPFWVNYLVNNA